MFNEGCLVKLNRTHSLLFERLKAIVSDSAPLVTAAGSSKLATLFGRVPALSAVA